ncbi:hypothetical protein [Sporosarcina limicola]|uniref:Uncharacterized protein n=1 Tax=Sporosarcina limicola TaxID=34101 RepID=A0A927MGI3_9BACL|nr:hypothetical protein [Sporosarcina limicola]MBE1553356.1 hypothetical protein [Sporosarcina limicola]
MERDFEWLWENLKEGARQKFEDVCCDVYSSEFPDADVHKVAVTQGDGGIDIYIDEENGKYPVPANFVGRELTRGFINGNE